MKVKFWGVRGSIPVPGPTTVRYGGNTSCLEIQGAQSECIVLEAGTGLRCLGLDLVKRKPLPPIHLFISHTHWDHIQGFPFFAPCYVPGSQIDVRGPVHFVESQSPSYAFDLQMKYEFFPISNQQLAAKIHYHSLAETDLAVGGVQIRTQFANHPILSLSYRLSENGRTIVYTGDHEPYFNLLEKDHKAAAHEDDFLFGDDMDESVEKANQRFLEFIRGAHVLVIDCQYTPEEYRTSRRNWGHSSWDYCLKWMQDGQVERMFLTHHDPLRSDEALDEMLKAARAVAAELKIDPERIQMAQEGLEVEV
jgi:phosphoribosyl 1,2-cyclic phosphodiesterase